MTPPAASTAANPSARTAAPPLRRPLAPRRISGPARRNIGVTARPAGAPSLLLRLVDHPLLDRLIRGRVWIGLITFGLMGVVAMQVTLLKLNRGIGTEIQRAQSLSRENSLLGAQVSALQASERIQGIAAAHGMVPAPAGEVRYLGIGSSDATRAASSITPPRVRTATSTSTRSTPASAGSSTAASSPAQGASSAALSGSAATSSPSSAPTTTSTTSSSSSTSTDPTASSATAAVAPGSSSDQSPSLAGAQGGTARRP